MTRPIKLPGPMDLLAVGGPLHGHVVTVKSTTRRVLVAPPDIVAEDLDRTPSLRLATHVKSGATIYEEGKDGATYDLERINGLLVLLDTQVRHDERTRRLVDALIAYAGLERH